MEEELVKISRLRIKERSCRYSLPLVHIKRHKLNQQSITGFIDYSKFKIMNMDDEVKLFGTWASPFSRRIELALKIKRVPYKFTQEDLDNKSPELLKYNPIHKKIPILVHNGRPIAESLVIMEYIDETWKNNPLLPANPYERAQARLLAKFVDEKILISSYKSFMCNDEERESAIEEACQDLEYLEKELLKGGKEFLGGENIGYADIVAFVLAYWNTVMQEVLGRDLINEEKSPAMCKWIKKLVEIDVVKEIIPPREEHKTYMNSRREKFRSASK